MKRLVVLAVLALPVSASLAHGQGCYGGGFGYGGPNVNLSIGSQQGYSYPPFYYSGGAPWQGQFAGPQSVPFGYSPGAYQGLPYGSGYASALPGVVDSAGFYGSPQQAPWMPYSPQSYGVPFQGQGRWVYCVNGQCR